MKKTGCLLILCFVLISFSSQGPENTEKSFFVFDSYEDYKNEKGKYVGEYNSFHWNSFGGTFVRYELDNLGEDIDIDDFWGFRIGEHYFRNKNSSPRIPVEIVMEKEKVFYLDGYIRLTALDDGEGASLRSKKAVYYSNDLQSKIYTIDKLIKKEDKNAALKILIPCLKKAKDRYGYQAQFNAYLKCLEQFSSDSLQGDILKQ